MRRAINESVGLFARTFEPRGPIIELGSLYVPGADALSNLRPYFPGREYIGCDMRSGLGVDRIEDAQHLTFRDGSVSTVMLFEILEHMPRPDLAITEAHRVLDDDGLLALSVPFSYKLHGFPTDYWRFTASGVYSMLGAFEDKVIFAAGPRLKPAFIFAVAAKRRSDDFDRKKAAFQHAVRLHFQRRRARGIASVLKERARDFFGALIGRAELDAPFFDGSARGGYILAADAKLPSSRRTSPTGSSAVV